MHLVTLLLPYLNDKGDLMGYVGLIDGVSLAQYQATVAGKADLSSFDHLFGMNGYQKLPNGVIMQWGTANNAPVTFPIPFPTEVVSVHATSTSNTTRTNNVACYAQTTTGFTLKSEDVCTWFAFGR